MIMSDEQYAVVAAKDAEIERLRADALAAVDATVAECRASHAAGFREGVEAALRWSWPETDDAGIADMMLIVTTLPENIRALAHPAATGEGA